MLSHASLNRSIHLHTPTIDNNNCSTISATELGMDNNSTTVGATEVGMDNNRHKTTAEPSVQQKYAWAITTNREQKLQAVSVTR